MLQWHCIPTVRQRLRLINKILKKEKKYTIHHRYGGILSLLSFLYLFILCVCMWERGIGTHKPWHTYRGVRDNFQESGLSTMCFRGQFLLFLFGLTSICFSCGAYSTLTVTPPQQKYFISRSLKTMKDPVSELSLIVAKTDPGPVENVLLC